MSDIITTCLLNLEQNHGTSSHGDYGQDLTDILYMLHLQIYCTVYAALTCEGGRGRGECGGGGDGGGHVVPGELGLTVGTGGGGQGLLGSALNVHGGLGDGPRHCNP